MCPLRLIVFIPSISQLSFRHVRYAMPWSISLNRASAATSKSFIHFTTWGFQPSFRIWEGISLPPHILSRQPPLSRLPTAATKSPLGYRPKLKFPPRQPLARFQKSLGEGYKRGGVDLTWQGGCPPGVAVLGGVAGGARRTTPVPVQSRGRH